MIGLDTNILVRLLVLDDEAQTASARRFVEQNCSPSSPAFINSVVLVEVVWVLVNPYKFSRGAVVEALESLLAGNDRVFEHHEAVRGALDDYRSGRGDFIDAFTVRINRAQGCKATATFDRKATKLDGFVRVH